VYILDLINNSVNEEKHPQSIESMVSEYFREASVLVLVFALLDRLISPQGVTVDWVLATCLVSLGLLVAGIIVERGQ
jgi:hypothetical protein